MSSRFQPYWNHTVYCAKKLGLAAGLSILVGCSATPPPRAFNPDNYAAVVRDQAIDIGPAIESPPADYPNNAIVKRLEGWVYLEYSIDTQGKVKDPRVLDASPAGVFNGSALEAISRYRYKPVMVKGEAIEVKRVRTKITYGF